MLLIAIILALRCWDNRFGRFGNRARGDWAAEIIGITGLIMLIFGVYLL